MSKESDLNLIESLAAQSEAIWLEINALRQARKLVGEASHLAGFLCGEAYESEGRHIERMRKKYPFLGYGSPAQMMSEAAMIANNKAAPKYHVEHLMLKPNSDGGR